MAEGLEQRCAELEKAVKYYKNIAEKTGQKRLREVEQLNRLISEHRRSERALRENEQRFRLIAQSTNDIFYEWDIKSGELKWFGDIDRALGYKVGEIQHTLDDWLRLIHPQDRPLLVDAVALHKESTKNINYTYRVVCKNGSVKFWNDNGTPVLDQEGKPQKWIGGISDITEQKNVEKEMENLQKRLQRSQKMESLALLAGGVAHDLNNILSGIVSYPELLLLDLPEDSNLKKPIKTMQESGHKAAEVVQDLLTVARGVAITKEVLGLNEVVGDYLNSPEFRRLSQFHPTVTVTTNLDSHLLNIKGSPIHITKLMMNLVSNASEAIEDAGNITISTFNCYVDTPLRRYDDINIGEYAVLSVSDNGAGISSDDIERIFEPFYTKKVMNRSGTGLGLAVVWNVVQDHGGYIDVKSNENGTTFKLYFPVTREDISDKDLAVPIDRIKGTGETILVVDDVAMQRDISCNMLNILGYNAQAVSSGEEAIEYLRNHTVELLFLDMIMAPGINGRETYEKILKIRPNQKAVVVSGFTETEEVKAVQKLGAGQYIKKPFILQKIGLAIKEEFEK